MGLLKYGMSVKQCLGSMILFIVVGIAFEMMSVLGSGVIFWNRSLDFGGLFLYSAAMYPAQILMSLDISGMVQASPYKKKIQTGAMSFASLCGNLTALAILLLVRGLGAWILPERAPLIWGMLPAIGIMGLGLSIMGAIMYKFYILSIIVLAVIFAIFGGINSYQDIMAVEYDSGIMGSMSVPVGVAFCLAMILLGNAAQYLIARALYRRPFSKGAFGSAAGKKFV